MPLRFAFSSCPARIVTCLTRLDESGFFTPIREKHFTELLTKLFERYKKSDVDSAIKVKGKPNTKQWRDALRTLTLVRLVEEVVSNQRGGRLAELITSIRQGITKEISVDALDLRTKECLRRFRPYNAYDKNLTEELSKFLEKPFIQDEHMKALILSEDLDSKSETAKGICFGFVVEWVRHQMNALQLGTHKKSGIKTLETKALSAKNIEDDHVLHGKEFKRPEEGQKLLQEKELALFKLQSGKKAQEALVLKKELENTSLLQAKDFSIKTCGLTLKKHRLQLQSEESFIEPTTVILEAKPHVFEDVAYIRSKSLGFKELVLRLKTAKLPAFFIISFKWAASQGTEKGAHVWAGSLSVSGLRMFDPNMGTFFTNSDPALLFDAMYEKWEKEDRVITQYLVLPISDSK